MIDASDVPRRIAVTRYVGHPHVLQGYPARVCLACGKSELQALFENEPCWEEEVQQVEYL